MCSSGGVDSPSAGGIVDGPASEANGDGAGLGGCARASGLDAKSMAPAVRLVTVARAASRIGRIRGGLGLMVGLPNGCTNSH
jgi:hypothetical protein